jgi:predicted nucleic acid-binding protein
VAATDLWILDTSVAVAWFFVGEPLRDRALAVGAHVGDAPARYVVPPLFHSELIHVLARKSGRHGPFVRDAVKLVLRLGIRTLALRESALLRAARWACKGLSGYDATFVALAEDVKGSWLTADDEAARLVGVRAARRLRDWRLGVE